jgi:hypothetical protein
MAEPKEFVLPSVLAFLGFLAFFSGGSDVPFLDDVLPYVCAAPFMIPACIIFSSRLGAVEKVGISLSDGMMTTEQYLEYKRTESLTGQQSIGYTIMIGSAISAGVIFVIGFVCLFFMASLSFGSSGDDFENTFQFFWGLLKICFWVYVGSHVLIARPWQYFVSEEEGDVPVEKRTLDCPSCGTGIRVPMSYTGRARCPSCGEEFKV